MGNYAYGGAGPNANRIWAGGLATALVAGLIIIVGVLTVRGVFTVPVLAPEEAGYFGDARTGVYAGVAGVAALAATGLMHLLLLTAPRPMSFFGWIAGLGTAVAVVSPFTRGAALESQVATSAINLLTGLAIISLLTGVGNAARPVRRRPAPGAGGYASGRRDAYRHPRLRDTRASDYDPDAETRLYGD